MRNPIIANTTALALYTTTTAASRTNPYVDAALEVGKVGVCIAADLVMLVLPEAINEMGKRAIAKAGLKPEPTEVAPAPEQKKRAALSSLLGAQLTAAKNAVHAAVSLILAAMKLTLNRTQVTVQRVRAVVASSVPALAQEIKALWNLSQKAPVATTAQA